MSHRPPVSGATPLAALEAVAFDLETTGLDPASARIVQVGAVAMAGEGSFETLVNPQVPVPPASSAIHNITDEMVAAAPAFAEAWESFEHFRQGRLLIGYAAGFDFAVIAAEAHRTGMAWQKPRALCVRLLAQAANPLLPDHSLDTIAGWLGVKLTGRHSALGDAHAAANVFAALLPHLARRNIRTLAQAERACLELDQTSGAHRPNGWVEPVSRPQVQEVFARVDPYAYRHRIRDIMSGPVAVVREDTSAADAVALMVELRISSLFVSASGEPGGLLAEYGIVTERDIMRLLAAHGAGALSRHVGDIASRPLASIADEAFLYRAIGRMDRLGIRHLAVRDVHGRLVGVVSARDLLRLRAGAAISLDDQIEAAGDGKALAAAWSMLPAVAGRLIAEEIAAPTIAAIVSEELRVATRRAAVLAESAMRQEGLGAPPCPYALMVLGSGGRGESLLAADQDNAIVFSEGEPGGPEDLWFAELGRRLAETLHAAGIDLCKGGVMARNDAWRGSSALWRRRIDDWVERSSPADLLNVDIFFDQRSVHGQTSLADELFAYSFERGTDVPYFPVLLGERMDSGSSPFNLIGGIVTQNDRIDLKRHGLFPIVAFARAVAIRHDLRHRGTRARLQAMIEQGIGNREEIASLLDAHALFLQLMLAQQAADIAAGIPVSNRVEIGTLASRQKARLKTALRAVTTLPMLLRALLGR